MNYEFHLITTFLLHTELKTSGSHIRCMGCREVLRIDREAPRHVAGMIEFESSHIPVVDPAAALGAEAAKINDSNCILIVEHGCGFKTFRTGILIQDMEEIMKLAAGVFETMPAAGASANMRFVLEMQNNPCYGAEILLESHMIFSVEERQTEAARERHNAPQDYPYNFLDDLEAMDLLERQMILEELALNRELWDPDSNVMCL